MIFTKQIQWSNINFKVDFSLESMRLKYGFHKKLLRYKWTSDHLNTFFLAFFPDQHWSEVHLYQNNFLQNPYCLTKSIFSYKIHILAWLNVPLNTSTTLLQLSYSFSLCCIHSTSVGFALPPPGGARAPLSNYQ